VAPAVASAAARLMSSLTFIADLCSS
jgi:hypothetical protein